jgi:hypothetical protein
MRKTSKDLYQEQHADNTAKTDKLVEWFTPTEEWKKWFAVVTGLVDILNCKEEKDG